MTALDTAYNYHQFTAHRALARIAGDLLPRFAVSTKVGYFPDGHDLRSRRLQQAAEQSATDLGRAPDTLLLHNPECSPHDFASACTALADMREQGLCRAWGVATWDPRPLLRASKDAPRPDVVMVRAGLTVPAAVLDAAEELAEHLGTEDLWGMAPFSGNTADPIWKYVDTSLFLAPGQRATPFQAGMAAAFTLPEVSRVAVGTSCLDHLAESARASCTDVNTENLKRYRSLLRQAATASR
ncbi:aldo/keto reductase [Streptomyces solisilvae]|uniref:aldo/keto reductase n=1 Tax=Streptomyces malaysiensis TaxID=92644 RepID=UPI00331C34E1